MPENKESYREDFMQKQICPCCKNLTPFEIDKGRYICPFCGAYMQNDRLEIIKENEK